MTRVGHAWLTLAAGACLLLIVGCSGATPRDMYFGTDAGEDFDVPARTVDSGAGAAGQTGAAGETAGTAGATAGAGGGTAGAGGSAGDADSGTTDAAPDTLSDGGAG